MEDLKNRIDSLIQLKEKEIEIWQNRLKEDNFEGFGKIFQVIYELHIFQLRNTIDILKILKESNEKTKITNI